jgi:hypothetical protein
VPFLIAAEVSIDNPIPCTVDGMSDIAAAVGFSELGRPIRSRKRAAGNVTKLSRECRPR